MMKVRWLALTAALLLPTLNLAAPPATEAVTYGQIIERPATTAPWALPLFVDLGSGPQFVCSSALVHQRVALTAGHCLEAMEGHRAYVRVGGNQLTTGRLISIQSSWQSPDYDPDSLESDIGLLLLSQPADAKALLRMPAPWRRIPAGPMELYGWGRTEDGVVTGSLSRLRVSRATSDAVLGFGGLFDPQDMIAVGRWEPQGGFFAGACNGDSGGPLVRLTPSGQPILLGVASYGARTCVTRSPSVYTLVRPHYDRLIGVMDRLLNRT